MEPLVVTYIAYLVITVPLTLWVGRTLRRNGRVFLMDVFGGDEDLASAVNHLLVVGFYLVNLGYVCLALKVSTEVLTATQAIEALSLKVGGVVLVLGVLHLGNLWVLNQLRRRAQLSPATHPPVAPDAWYPTPNAVQAPA